MQEQRQKEGEGCNNIHGASSFMIFACLFIVVVVVVVFLVEGVIKRNN